MPPASSSRTRCANTRQVLSGTRAAHRGSSRHPVARRASGLGQAIVEIVEVGMGNLDLEGAHAGIATGFPVVTLLLADVPTTIIASIGESSSSWLRGEDFRGGRLAVSTEVRKNARTSSISNSGFSIAAKCPPLSNSDQWTIRASGSARRRMAMSWVVLNSHPVGTVPRSFGANRLGSWYSHRSRGSPTTQRYW